MDLPIGKGQKFLNGGNGAVQKFTSGWSVSGTSTFQDGYPLALTATPNVTGFGYGLRPNVVPGCNPKLERFGAVTTERLVQYFVLHGSGLLHPGKRERD